MASTIYASVASSKVIQAFVVHSWGWLSGNVSVKIPELTSLWCSTLWTVGTNAIVDYGGFLLWAAIHWSHSSLWTPAVHCMVNWRPFTFIRMCSHPTACWFSFLPDPVLWTMVKRASQVICLLAAFATSRWANWFLRWGRVPMIDIFDVPPANRQDLDPLAPGWEGCVSIICWRGIGGEDDDEKKWEDLRTISLAACQNGISSSQHVCYTKDQHCWVWLQVAGVSHRHAMCNKLVRCRLVVHRDILWCMTTDIAWWSEIKMTWFEGKDVCWCLYQTIPRIIHEMDANNQVRL